MRIFNSMDFNKCAIALSRAKTPADVEIAWSLLKGDFPSLSAIVALENYEKKFIPISLNKYTEDPTNYLVKYFSNENLYFVDDALISRTYSSGEGKFGIDHSIMLDTNIATYINKIVRNEPLGNIQEKVEELLGNVLRDNLNFDHLFYMIENTKNIPGNINYRKISKLNFWKILDIKFRKNMVSLQIFRSIDSEEFRATNTIQTKFSYLSAVRQAINFCYDFYLSDVGRNHADSFILIQRLILLNLIGMVRIQLSSKKNSKFKIREYFDYINNVTGVYLDREAIIAHKYFHKRDSIKILEKIKKGKNNSRLLRQLDNIAWDMAAPRFMEKLIGLAENEQYFVPMFLTFDSGLRELLSTYRVKCAIFDRDNNSVVQIPEISTLEYFEEHGCLHEIKQLNNEASKHGRLSGEKKNRLSMHKLIRREYKLLRSVL